MKPLRNKISFSVMVIIEPDDDRFHAFCPALKGLHVEGATEEEACKNAADAAIAYLKSLIKHQDPIPLGIIVKKEEEEIFLRTPAKCIRQIPVYV
jgi:predicted RNase H-like HicB family nuclease